MPQIIPKSTVFNYGKSVELPESTVAKKNDLFLTNVKFLQTAVHHAILDRALKGRLELRRVLGSTPALASPILDPKMINPGDTLVEVTYDVKGPSNLGNHGGFIKVLSVPNEEDLAMILNYMRWFNYYKSPEHVNEISDAEFNLVFKKLQTTLINSFKVKRLELLSVSTAAKRGGTMIKIGNDIPPLDEQDKNMYGVFYHQDANTVTLYEAIMIYNRIIFNKTFRLNHNIFGNFKKMLEAATIVANYLERYRKDLSNCNHFTYHTLRILLEMNNSTMAQENSGLILEQKI